MIVAATKADLKIVSVGSKTYLSKTQNCLDFQFMVSESQLGVENVFFNIQGDRI